MQVDRLAKELGRQDAMLRQAEVQDQEMKGEIAVARRCDPSLHLQQPYVSVTRGGKRTTGAKYTACGKHRQQSMAALGTGQPQHISQC